MEDDECYKKCPHHTRIETHMTDGEDFRLKVNTNETNIANFKEWLEKVEKKVDSLLWKFILASLIVQVTGISIVKVFS